VKKDEILISDPFKKEKSKLRRIQKLLNKNPNASKRRDLLKVQTSLQSIINSKPKGGVSLG
jgi:hypothetical protein